MALRSITIDENEDGTATVYFKPERVQVECDDWEQALECASGGLEEE
ncbi:hypothetical protein ACNO5E_13375 [Vibrio parahaemolyticus]|nr:hypothetical protein [Vibrio parahaemolyticus]